MSKIFHTHCSEKGIVFGGTPSFLRLKRKAEDKLKEVNVAYETVRSFLSGRHKVEPEQETAPEPQAEAEARTKARAVETCGKVMGCWGSAGSRNEFTVHFILS